MSNDVKRYMICGGGAHEAPGGTWVRADDYERLKQHITEIEQLHREHLEEVEAALEHEQVTVLSLQEHLDEGVYIQPEQIDALWYELKCCRHQGLLYEIGIVECPECLGGERLGGLPEDCPRCYGHKWIKEEHGDE